MPDLEFGVSAIGCYHHGFDEVRDRNVDSAYGISLFAESWGRGVNVGRKNELLLSER